MASALDVLNIARSQIGFVEGPNNDSPYGKWYGMNHQPYCAMGVSWCFAQVGLSSLVAAQTPKGFAYCPAGMAWFQKQGRIINKFQGMPGDIVFFSFDGSGVPDHVEILEAASPGGITTIGFNTSPDHSNGSQQNGGGCYRRHRPYLYVVAIARPNYPVIAKPTVAKSTSKKTTAAVAGTGAAVAGVTGVTHPGTTDNSTPVPSPSPTVFVAPPFPTQANAFKVGAKSDAVLAVEKALFKAGLLPKNLVDALFTKEDIAAVKAYQKKKKLKVDGIVGKATYSQVVKDIS